jgi:hypothetical protein
MPFPGEERFREALAREENHEGDAAMVKVADLKAALTEIERLRSERDEADAVVARSFPSAKSGTVRDDTLRCVERHRARVAL